MYSHISCVCVLAMAFTLSHTHTHTHTNISANDYPINMTKDLYILLLYTHAHTHCTCVNHLRSSDRLRSLARCSSDPLPRRGPRFRSSNRGSGRRGRRFGCSAYKEIESLKTLARAAFLTVKSSASLNVIRRPAAGS